tara:strand:+ start:63 stop:173 length:111 start_codon:yes stop_codon:yes gene_type:complete
MEPCTLSFGMMLAILFKAVVFYYRPSGVNYQQEEEE